VQQALAESAFREALVFEHDALQLAAALPEFPLAQVAAQRRVADGLKDVNHVEQGAGVVGMPAGFLGLG
jgi:hypothetical protein